MSDTPRTDAKEHESEDGGMERHAYYGWKFARTLEREIAKLKQERDEAYERAAQVCDGRAAWSSLHGFQKEYYEAEECAYEIRALKSEPTEGK